MTEITLGRKIKLYCNIITADILIATSKTRYYMPSLMHIDEQNRKATIGSLANSLFAGSLPMGNAVMDFLITSKLIQKIDQRQQITDDSFETSNFNSEYDQRYQGLDLSGMLGFFETSNFNSEYDQPYEITDIGKKSICNKKIFVKQHELWKIYYTEDLLIPSENRIVQIIKQGKDPIEFSDDGKLKRDQPIPKPINSKIENLNGRYFTPIFGDKLDDFQIDTIDKYTKSCDSDLNVRINWKVSNSNNVLKVISSGISTSESSSYKPHSTTDQTSFKVLSPPNIEYDKLWVTLLDEFNIYDDWDFTNNHLLQYYEDTTLEERISMKQIFNESPTIEKYGTFDDLRLTVGIYPKPEDMERWAIDLVYDQIIDYLTQEKYEKIKEDVKKKFPDVEKFPSTQDLLDKYDDPQESKFWYIHAMEDWNIE